MDAAAEKLIPQPDVTEENDETWNDQDQIKETETTVPLALSIHSEESGSVLLGSGSRTSPAGDPQDSSDISNQVESKIENHMVRLRHGLQTDGPIETDLSATSTAATSAAATNASQEGYRLADGTEMNNDQVVTANYKKQCEDNEGVRGTCDNQVSVVLDLKQESVSSSDGQDAGPNIQDNQTDSRIPSDNGNDEIAATSPKQERQEEVAENIERSQNDKDEAFTNPTGKSDVSKDGQDIGRDSLNGNSGPLARPEDDNGEAATSNPRQEGDDSNGEFVSPDKPPGDRGNDDRSTETENDDDYASGAAIAMAAVAAAASANTSSPSAAAEAARAMAPSLVPSAISTRNEDITIVRLSAVKTQMLKRMDAALKPNHGDQGLDSQQLRDVVQQRLAHGDNDAFLQYMLLFQYFQTFDETRESLDLLPAGEVADPAMTDDQSSGQSKALTSSEKVRSMLHMAEDAYDAMDSLLPSSLNAEQINANDGDAEYYGIDAPLVVPDLLPPCTSVPGDATLQFFLACRGERKEEHLDGPAGGDASMMDTVSESGTAITDRTSEPDTVDASGAHKSAAAVFTNMFSSMTRTAKNPPARPPSTLVGVFRKRTRPNESVSSEKEDEATRRSSVDGDLATGEYSVSIDREMLGLTVENVLERTVVRTVLPGGAAKKAGAKVGSLIVKVGNVETKNLTHFETIDELRQSQRPLKLVLRQIASGALRSAREEMGRLIRGGGFGTALPVEQNENTEVDRRLIATSFRRTHDGKPINVQAFSQVVHQRWNKDGTIYPNKKEEALVHAGEKLVWILTLLVIGLEREASLAPSGAAREKSSEGSPGRRSHTSHMGEDYADAAKSVSKVLFDFVSSKLLSGLNQEGDSGKGADDAVMGNPANRNRRGPPPPPPTAGRYGARARAQDAINAKRSRDAHNLLLRIGDVLHRTRTFLADPASPPAALLRGEVISFLCDILDIDTGMELSEEEDESPSVGINAAPINDLGSAGSLLKLIILNCSMMRSPGCTCLTYTSNDLDLEEEQRRRFGSLKKQLSGLDLHRFHAGNRFLAVVHRLAASRSISARVTACSLGPVLWGHLDFPHQLQLRGVITRALHDVDVIVRKSTASVLHEIAELIFDPRAVPWLVLMCERAMTDPEPQLRAAAMTLTWHLSDHLPNAFLGDASQGSRSLRRLPDRSDPTFAEVYLLQCKLLPVATRLAEDRAPSVRLAVAAQCDRLCNSLGEHWYSVIVDVLQELLGDMDENVRGEAILCVPRLAEIVLVTTKRAGVGVLEALLPVSVKLLNDPSPNVRIALATAAGDLLTLLVGLQSLHEISPPSAGDKLSEISEKSNKKHVDDTLIPLLQKLLNDTEPEVTSAALRAVTNASRGNVREIRARRHSIAVDDDSVSISSFQSHTSLERKDPVFIPVLSEEQVMRLLPTLTGLANSRQWRVRQGAVEIVPALLGCTSKLEIRSEVAQLCFRLMNDRVDAVRRTAAECLCLSGGSLGSHGEESAGEWVVAIVIPHVRNCSQSVDSKQRILSLKMVEVILANGICPSKRKSARPGSSAEPRPSPPQLDLVNIAVSLSSDTVANVRLNFGRLACSVISIINEEELGVLTKALDDQIDAEKKRERGGDRDVLFYATRAIMRSKEKDEMFLPSLQDGFGRGI